MKISRQRDFQTGRILLSGPKDSSTLIGPEVSREESGHEPERKKTGLIKESPCRLCSHDLLQPGTADSCLSSLAFPLSDFQVMMESEDLERTHPFRNNPKISCPIPSSGGNRSLRPSFILQCHSNNLVVMAGILGMTKEDG